ncbi:MAG: glycosyltransferase family 9 protein [Candidatus Omnitrophica bacterium]|nr:glycosyltransferase family 9 protein [Candidatus Omnitrophota bacterium]
MKIKKIALLIYFFLRLPLICLLKLAFPARSDRATEVSSVLVIRIDRMGDFILSLPVFDNLRLKYPKARITVAVRPYLKDLAGLVKDIDQVIVCENVFAAAGKIRKQKFDLALDLLCGWRLDSALLAFMSRAPVRAGFKGGFRELLFTHKICAESFAGKTMAELNLEVLNSFGVPVIVTEPRLRLDKKNTDELVIALHPGGYYKSQRWGADRFALLGKKILERYKVKLAVLGSFEEKQLAGYISQGINNNNARVVLTGMKDLVFFLSGCKLLVCNNSGPLHLAAALGVPTVSMMGPTDPVLWRPAGKNHVVIRKALSCSPCGKAECERRECLDLIGVDEVFSAVKSQLDKIYGIK